MIIKTTIIIKLSQPRPNTGEFSQLLNLSIVQHQVSVKEQLSETFWPCRLKGSGKGAGTSRWCFCWSVERKRLSLCQTGVATAWQSSRWRTSQEPCTLVCTVTKKKQKNKKNPIDIRGQRSSYYQTHDIFTENTLLEYYQVRLTSSTTHLLYELLYTLDDMFVELEEMKGKFFLFQLSSVKVLLAKEGNHFQTGQLLTDR